MHNVPELFDANLGSPAAIGQRQESLYSLDSLLQARYQLRLQRESSLGAAVNLTKNREVYLLSRFFNPDLVFLFPSSIAAEHLLDALVRWQFENQVFRFL